METESVKAKPFLKWAGGKGQLLTEIQKYYPFADKKITKYAEPFIGGGAVLFDVLNRYDLSEVYISDINAELVNCYWAAQQCVEELIQALTKIRLNNACILLSEGNLSVTEIAYLTGFSSVSYFGKLFKDAFSCSPKEYRTKKLVPQTYIFSDMDVLENFKNTDES